MTTGRVLRISEASAGSSRASQTSNLFIGSGVWTLPLASVPFLPGLSEGPQLLKVALQFLLANRAQRFGPAFARPPRVSGHDERFILNRDRGFAAEAAGVQQFLGQVLRRACPATPSPARSGRRQG
jgi:hypothetical protein